MRRVVLIGSGATALAVLNTLANRNGIHVTLVRPPRELPSASGVGSGLPIAHSVEASIAELRSELGLKFPPPKSHFGMMPETLHVQGWGNIWRSNLHGGLTQFWGGSMVPFTEREFRRWPIGRSELDDDYRAIAERVGITGAEDALRAYLHDDFAKMPPIDPVSAIGTLTKRICSVEGSSFETLAGAPRLAVETRSSEHNTCKYTGECMTGCSRGAVFSARNAIEFHLAQEEISEECRGIAERIDFDRYNVQVRLENGTLAQIDYDLIFICAGCVHSTELIMKSLETNPETPISDNMILSFPVFYGGNLSQDSGAGGYLALTNGMIILAPHDAEAPATFVQLYPNPDYFWQYNLPRWIWPTLTGIARMGRRRLFWARAYVASEHSQAYEFMRAADGTALELALARPPNLAVFTESIWPRLRQSFANAGFWVPPMGPAKARTSSHYAGGFPMGGTLVGKDGALGNGVFLCDSANFPDCPALSPTFTAMANARRIARHALQT